MNQKNNQRYKENQQLIEKNFLSLLEKKEISRITVRELCELTGINRATFYHHYLDIYDLMEKTERRIQQEFIDSVPEETWKKTRQAYLDPEVLALLIGHFSNYPAFYIQAIRNRQFGAVSTAFQDVWKQHFIPLFQSYGIQNEHNMKYYFDFYLSGALGVIRDWLEDGCQETPAEIAKIIITFLPSSYTISD